MADKLSRAGRFLELVERSDLSPQGLRSLPSQDHRLIVAHALLQRGELKLASSIAHQENHPTSKATIRSRCDWILGLVAQCEGHLEVAITHLQNAARLAQAANDAEAAAWPQLALIRMLTAGRPKEVIAAMVVEVRPAVTRAGNPHLTGYFHDTVAIVEAQFGRLLEAQRHLNIERSLLDRYPNAWLEQTYEVDASCIAYLNCDYAAASRHIANARRLGSISGNDFSQTVLELNEAHLDLLVGRFRDAQRKLRGLQRSGSCLPRLAALDGLARLYIALDQLDECEAVLASIDAEAGEPHRSSSYPVRLSATSRLRMLIRTDRFNEAVERAETEIRNRRKSDDLPLVVELSLLQAEALARSGQHTMAGRKLLDAAREGATSLREQQGNYYEACGRVLELYRSSLGARLRARATRLWQHQNNVWAQTDASLVRSHGTDHRTVRSETSAVASSAAAAVNQIAAAFDLAFAPRLLGHELLDLLRMLRCAARAEIAAAPQGQTSSASTDTAHGVTIPLGVDRETAIALRCTPGDDPVQNVLLADVIRIAHAAVGLETARREEASRAAFWPEGSAEHNRDGLFVSQETLAVVSKARRIAGPNIPVLITGETGTGKEVLARVIHAASPRASAPFLPFNCAACPKDMVDAQLFGHRRGAFTGAVEHASGVIRAAAGGTLFFDEIGETPLEVQPKLLRFLESGDVHPIGEPHPLHVDVRVIAATNADLDGEVAAGRFREDLFYRLNIVRLHLPPLRERRVEIPAFAEHYLTRYARELDKGNLRLAEETVEYLLLYKWPGNVRQLANEIRRMVALAERDGVLMPEHLSSNIVASRRTVPASERELEPTEVVVRLDQPMAAAMEHLERAMVNYALTASGGHMEAAARRLGLSRKGLYLKRQRFGLEPPAAVRPS
jgi:DNA-binding NtrC family response regulator